jgi:hypothetical protein
LPLFALLGELLHGAVHVATILWLGGSVYDLSGLGRDPSPWGIINFHFSLPNDAFDVVYGAPFVAWIWIAATGSIVLARMHPSTVSRALFVVCELTPMAAISTVLALGYTVPRGTLLSTVHDHPVIPAIAALCGLPLVATLAWRHFRRHWDGLSVWEFGFGYCAMIAAPWLLLLVA